MTDDGPEARKPAQVAGTQSGSRSRDFAARDRQLVVVIVAVLVAAPSFAYVLFCATAERPLRFIGAGGVLASAAFASGSLFGLLFGIPPARRGSEVLETNSSLQQVSEWLTKVILGASLTQVGNLAPAVAKFGARYGGDVGGSGVAICLLVHFVVTGFIAGYLFTRVFLQHVFYRADAPPPSIGHSVEPTADPQLLPNPSALPTSGTAGGHP